MTVEDLNSADSTAAQMTDVDMTADQVNAEGMTLASMVAPESDAYDVMAPEMTALELTVETIAPEMTAALAAAPELPADDIIAAKMAVELTAFETTGLRLTAVEMPAPTCHKAQKRTLLQNYHAELMGCLCPLRSGLLSATAKARQEVQDAFWKGLEMTKTVVHSCCWTVEAVRMLVLAQA